MKFLRILAAIVALFTGVSIMAEPASKLTDGLTFYSSFDQSLTPDRAAGASAVEGNYTATTGRVGKAITGQSACRYICAGNLNRKKGSVSFWFRPDAAIDTGKPLGRIFSTDWLDSICLEHHPEHGVIYYMTACTPPGKDWQWDYSLPVRQTLFKQGQWHHIVLTWDVDLESAGADVFNLDIGKTRQGRKKAYVNGNLVGSAAIPQIDGKEEGGFRFYPSGLYAADELMVWKRVLTGQEVKKLYESPDTIAKAIRVLPTVAKQQDWQVKPDLVYRNYIDSLISPGQSFNCDVPIKNLTARPVSGTIRLRLLDVWEKPCGDEVVQKFSLKAGESANIPVVFAPEKLGVFKIEATVEADGISKKRDVTSFACIPEGCPPKHPFFGNHVNFTPGMPEMARRLGVAVHRVHDMTQYTWWNIMEPDKGNMLMAQRNLYEDAIKLDFDQMGEWFSTPYWAVTYADGTHPAKPAELFTYPVGNIPTDMEAYRKYVREAIVRHPVIKEWCIWNEPFSTFFFNAPAKDYIRICAETYKIAKETDPKLMIYAFVSEGLWGKAVLKEQVWKYCDGLTYHWYTTLGEWDDAINNIRTLKKQIKKYTDKDIPLVNSEGGIANGTTFLRGLDFPQLPPENTRAPMNFRLAAERCIQYYVTTMAEGVRGFYYYDHEPTWPVTSYSGWQTVEVTRTPRPFMVATCMLAWQIDGGKYIGQLELPGSLHLYFFERKDGTAMAVAWSVNGGIVELKTDARIYDLMGNGVKTDGVVRITDAPCYLRSPLKAAAFMEKMKNQPVTIIKTPQAKTAATKPGAYVPEKMENYSIAAELGTARMIPVDLKPFANRGFADNRDGGVGGWTGEGDMNDMRSLKPGIHTWLGTPLTIIDPAANGGKSVIALRGRTLPKEPLSSPAIPIDRKARGFFFLQASNYAQVLNARAGTYHVLYADEQTVDIPIVIGVNTYDWWFDHQDSEDSRTVPVKVENADESQPYRFLRLWYWENTRQNVPVKSITMSTQPGSPASLLLLSINIAVW